MPLFDKYKKDSEETLAKIKNKKKVEIADEEKIQEEYDSLDNKARKAILIKQIKEAELIAYKTEMASMELKKAAGLLIEKNLAEFLYFGYLEKINFEIIGLTKRNETRIENLYNEKDFKGLIKMMDRELKNILINVKKNSLESVEEWRKELRGDTQ